MTNPNRKSDRDLDPLFNATAEALLARVNSGEVTAAELNAAINFLKLNGITADVNHNKNLKRLQDGLADAPFAFDNDSEADIPTSRTVQ